MTGESISPTTRAVRDDMDWDAGQFCQKLRPTQNRHRAVKRCVPEPYVGTVERPLLGTSQWPIESARGNPNQAQMGAG